MSLSMLSALPFLTQQQMALGIKYFIAITCESCLIKLPQITFWILQKFFCNPQTKSPGYSPDWIYNIYPPVTLN